MEAKELRIGNWIKFNDTPIANGCYEVMAIQESLVVAKNGGAAYPNEIEPIPITEKWLVNFGFEKKYSLYWDKNDIAIFDDNGEFSFELMGSDTEVFKITNIPYVHSLQNLYFCLTGEELVCV